MNWRKLFGTIWNSFRIGGPSGPSLDQVGATDRLRLSDNLRWLDGGVAEAGVLALDSSGDARVVKHNLAGAAAPVVTDDSASGYEINSRWLDLTNFKVYECLDASVGAAVWVLLGPASDLWAALNALDAILPSVTPCGISSRNQHPILTFDDGASVVNETVLFNCVMSKDYRGGAFSCDIDWVSEDQIAGGVTWGVSIERMAAGGTDIDADSFATEQTGTLTTNATSGVVNRTTIAFTQVQADNIVAGDSFRLRARRLTGDVGDTMTNDAEILRVIGRQ